LDVPGRKIAEVFEAAWGVGIYWDDECPVPEIMVVYEPVKGQRNKEIYVEDM
jgi:hypothetical protein